MGDEYAEQTEQEELFTPQGRMAGETLKLGLLLLSVATPVMLVVSTFIDGWTFIGVVVAAFKGFLLLLGATAATYLIWTVARAFVGAAKEVRSNGG